MNTSRRPSVVAVVALSLVSIAAGCAGNSQGAVPQTGAVSPQSVSQQSSSQADTSKRCSSDNGVSLKPCFVRLTVSDPTQTVTAKGPKNGMFSYRDMGCTKKDVATITGSGDTYQVTAGTASGTCFAIFTDRKTNGTKVGTARLSISNQV